jgi:hypothetical protein
MSKLYDEILGDLVYDGGWSKSENIVLWGNDIPIKTVAVADEYENVNSNQRESYLWIKKELVNVSCKSNSLMNNYINEKAEDIKPILGLSSIPHDISDIVRPKWMLIQQDGRIGILCDTSWDSHGVAIIVDRRKNIEVGPQNLIW